MKIFDKSGQHIGDNSQAIQAEGNVTIGNTTQEVIAICNLVIDTKFAALQQEALQEARSRANEFGTQISQKLASNIDERIEAKLADPDIQFAISEATTIVARKGDQTKSELLQEIIISKINNNNDEEKDLLLDLAIETSKRLTTTEIKLLAYIFYFRYICPYQGEVSAENIIKDYKNNIVHPHVTLEECYLKYKAFFTLKDNPTLNRIIKDIDSIVPVKTHLLQLKGCVGSTTLGYKRNYKELIFECTNIQINSDEDLQLNFSCIKEILNNFGIENLDNFNKIVINELGCIIAENYINAQGGLN